MPGGIGSFGELRNDLEFPALPLRSLRLCGE
jgi:hypothetical protein